MKFSIKLFLLINKYSKAFCSEFLFPHTGTVTFSLQLTIAKSTKKSVVPGPRVLRIRAWVFLAHIKIKILIRKQKQGTLSPVCASLKNSKYICNVTSTDYSCV